MIKDEILEILKIFDELQISEEMQRELFKNGLKFDFTYGDPDTNNINQHLNIFGVGMLLKTILAGHTEYNVKKLLEQPYSFPDEKLIKEISKLQDGKRSKVKTLVKIEKLGEK